ncbi:6-phosphogluconolactonase [soil metagenome]
MQPLELQAYQSAEAASRAAAAHIANRARASIAERGRFLVAFSGGRSPAGMLQALSSEDLPWNLIHVFQVDERVAPAGHADRNLTMLRESLFERVDIPAGQIHPMPVEAADLEDASSTYAHTLRKVAGNPPRLDLIHLGIGDDGHTASLVPGDPVLEVRDREIALTGVYEGRRRMTMTFPVLDGARSRVWLVIEPEKHAMLARLLDGDRSIPAGRVSADSTTVFADQATAGS